MKTTAYVYGGLTIVLGAVLCSFHIFYLTLQQHCGLFPFPFYKRKRSIGLREVEQ